MTIGIFVKIGVLILWGGAIPFFLGFMLAHKIDQQNTSICRAVIFGYLIVLALFQVVYVVVLLNWNSFDWLYRIFNGIIFIILIISLKYYVTIKKLDKNKVKEKNKWKFNVLWLLFFVLFLLQIYKTIFYSYADGDDAFYTVTSVITNLKRSMYINIPYTGETSVLDFRHAFSSAPIFISFLAEASGIHPTIITNIVFSVIVIILNNMIHLEIGKLLLDTRKRYLPYYMIFINLLYLYNNETIYSSATFLLTRTGQGKAFLANIIPTVSILFLLIVSEKLKKEAFLQKEVLICYSVASCIMLTAGYTSTMGIILGPLVIMGGTVLLSLIDRTKKLYMASVLSVLPLALLTGIYLLYEMIG